MDELFGGVERRMGSVEISEPRLVAGGFQRRLGRGLGLARYRSPWSPASTPEVEFLFAGGEVILFAGGETVIAA